MSPFFGVPIAASMDLTSFATESLSILVHRTTGMPIALACAAYSLLVMPYGGRNRVASLPVALRITALVRMISTTAFSLVISLPWDHEWLAMQ